MGNFPLGFPDCSYGAVPVSVLRVREEDKRVGSLGPGSRGLEGLGMCPVLQQEVDSHCAGSEVHRSYPLPTDALEGHALGICRCLR